MSWIWRSFLTFSVFPILVLTGCSAYQPTKNIWKGTKGLWNSYVSPPATIDFDERGTLSPRALALTNAMMGIDVELARLERAMQNADKPPTRAWLNKFFETFPWVNGFAGVKYDGTILGQEPPDSANGIDFIPLLYEDKKQSSRALRADVQNTQQGPVILLSAPLYDGTVFLGIVAAYFDIRSLMHFSSAPQDLIIMTPYALLWSGKFDFAATPLAGVDWKDVVIKSTSGTCSNSTGAFFYMVRYLGNLPIIFACAQEGSFPEGDGSLEQGMAFFKDDRQKLPPPIHEDHEIGADRAIPSFKEPQEEQEMAESAPHTESGDSLPDSPGVSGENKKPLPRKSSPARRRIAERQLEGENIEVERTPEVRKRKREQRQEKPLELIPSSDSPRLPGGRPSPFGPRPEENEKTDVSKIEASEPDSSRGEVSQPVPSGNIGSESVEQESAPEADALSPQSPPMLPGGRPSPFGPGKVQ